MSKTLTRTGKNRRQTGNRPANLDPKSHRRLLRLARALPLAVGLAIPAGQAWAADAAAQKSVRAEIEELKERIEELEGSVEDHDAKIGSRAVVHAFDALKLDVGGFVDLAFTAAIGEDSSKVEFNRQVFELLVKANLWQDWEIFVAQAFVRARPVDFTDRLNPTFDDLNSPVDTDTVLANVTYRHSDLFTVQAGRFITPHGIINIEHFPAALLDPNQPQFLRPFPGQSMFANFTNGAQVFGTSFLGENGQNSLKYHLYAGSWAGNATHINMGGRLAYSMSDYGVTVGANATFGERNRGVNSDYFVYGADLLIDKGPVLWKSEVFVTDEDLGGDRFAAYTQPAYRLSDQWTAFYRFDYLDNGSAGGISTENAVGLSFKPNPNVHLRTIYTFKRFEDGGGEPNADAHILQLSSTLNF